MSGAQPVAFSRFGAFVLVAFGCAVFLAMIYLIASGAEFGGGGRDGEAHANGSGLNGYAGLTRLLEAEGYEVTRSRSPSGLKTEGLLVLTPTPYTDAEEFAEILKDRENLGPTLVILPKWNATLPPQNLPPKAREKFKQGWVILGDAVPAEWSADLPAPYRLTHLAAKPAAKGRLPSWGGYGIKGQLPTQTVLYAKADPAHRSLVTDGSGHALAVLIEGEEGEDYYENAHWTAFVADADLMNNYGLADGARARAALALVEELSYDGDISEVTFDLTLNGFGASENLLTLAFRPPFLAATLCLLMALLIVGWRAFQRFGPAAASGGPAIAFGKRRLIANGAGLIVRARRFRLLGAPYAALSARRIADRLGLVRHDRESIDAALARRLPDEEPFSRRAARMEAATKPADILSAAQALDTLATKLSQGK